MIKLYKNENKNNQLKEIVKAIRENGRWLPADVVCNTYNCSYEMGKKVAWLTNPSCDRQIEICNTIGKEYALYVPTGCK